MIKKKNKKRTLLTGFRNSFFFGILGVILSLFTFQNLRAQILAGPDIKFNSLVEIQMTGLTPISQSGAAWDPVPIQLTRSFDLSYEANFGDIDAGGFGIHFVLQQDPRPLDQTFGDIGPYNAIHGDGSGNEISPAFFIEFDTHDDFPGVPFFDDVVFFDHLSWGNTLNDPNNNQVAIGNNGNIEDGQYHDIRIVWEANCQNFIVFIDGFEELRIENYDVVDDVFGGDPEVVWGFTASTGGSPGNVSGRNIQLIRNITFTQDCFANLDFNVSGFSVPMGTHAVTNFITAGTVGPNDNPVEITPVDFTEFRAGGFIELNRNFDANMGVGGAFLAHIVPCGEDVICKRNLSEEDDSQVEEYLPEPIVLYPNPVQSGENIRINWQLATNQIESLQIFDVSGRMLSKQPQWRSFDTGIEIQTNQLSKGTYLVAVKTNQDKPQHFKFTVQ